MTRAQEIRKEVLLQLYASRPLAMSADLMARQARKSGLDYTATEIKAECAFLHGQELVQLQRDSISGEQKYAISSQGILAHENN